MTKKVGRPIEKINRTKVGLSLDGKFNDMLNQLSTNTGKSKSRLVEEGIAIIYELEHKKNEILNSKSNDISNPFDTLRDMFNAKYN